MRIKRFLAFVLFLVTTGGHIGLALTFKIGQLKVAHMLIITV